MVEVMARTLEHPSSYLDLEENCMLRTLFGSIRHADFIHHINLAKKLYYEKRKRKSLDCSFFPV